LMTLLKRFGMGAVGFTMMLTAIAIQWGLLCEVTYSMDTISECVPRLILVLFCRTSFLNYTTLIRNLGSIFR
jgi:hypothetical protein